MKPEQIVKIIKNNEVLFNGYTGDCAIDPVDYHKIASEISQKQDEEMKKVVEWLKVLMDGDKASQVCIYDKVDQFIKEHEK
jgi:hypothetical protein